MRVIFDLLSLGWLMGDEEWFRSSFLLDYGGYVLALIIKKDVSLWLINPVPYFLRYV